MNLLYCATQFAHSTSCARATAMFALSYSVAVIILAAVPLARFAAEINFVNFDPCLSEFGLHRIVHGDTNLLQYLPSGLLGHANFALQPVNGNALLPFQD